jgi:hypothetical protein
MAKYVVGPIVGHGELEAGPVRAEVPAIPKWSSDSSGQSRADLDGAQSKNRWTATRNSPSSSGTSGP